MTKISGVGAGLFVNQFDVSGDIGAMNSMSITSNLQDDTGLEKDGTERLVLRSDAEMSYAAFFNPSAGASVPVLEPLTTALATYLTKRTLGSRTRTLTGVKSSWGVTRGTDGSLAATGQLQASIGRPIEAGYLLTVGKQTFADNTAVIAYVDRGAGSASSFGIAAALHVISIGSGTATVVVQESADHVAWSTAVTFTAATGATSEYLRSGLTATVRRYLRMSVTGTFTNLVAVVAAMPYRSQQS